MSSVPDPTLDVLKKEMDLVQAGITYYGDVQFKIKAWAVAAFSAFIALAVERGVWMLLPATVVMLLFLILDAFYKSLQAVYITRAAALAQHIRATLGTEQSYGDSWQAFAIEEALKEWGDDTLRGLVAGMVACIRRPQILFLYASLLLTLLVVWVLIGGEYIPAGSE